MSHTDTLRARPRRSIADLALRLRLSGVVVFLLLLGAVFATLAPQFLTWQNLGVIASNAAILGMVAASQGVVLLTCTLEVSMSAIMGLPSYLSAESAPTHPDAGSK